MSTSDERTMKALDRFLFGTIVDVDYDEFLRNQRDFQWYCDIEKRELELERVSRQVCERCRTVFRNNYNRVDEIPTWKMLCEHCQIEWEQEQKKTCAYCGQEFIAGKTRQGKLSASDMLEHLCNDCFEDVFLRKELLRVRSQVYRAKRAGLEASLRLIEWIEILDRYARRCAICGNNYSEMDHIIPVSKGGGTTRENVQPLCRLCNRQKKNNG